MGSSASMSKSERVELGQLIRKRERVMKAGARERSAKMMAEFDMQSAQIYKFDDDKVWEEATRVAQAAADEASAVIAERCRALGIPEEFAPGLNLGWYSRGQNAVASRRAELRRMAKSRIEAMEVETITKIERLSLDAQTGIVMQGLESPAAKAFLESLPAIEMLMPSIDPHALKVLIENRARA